MKRVSLALLFLPFTLLAAYDHTDLWNEQKDIPHFQEGQIACQPNMVKTESFRPDKRFMPYLDWYKAPTGTSTNKPCLILLSGGAYNSIADMDKISTWQKTFTPLGIQCVVLYYRTPRPDGLPIYQSAWDDGQRAVRVVRSMAASRGIDPEKIGVIGMSAGSHLATLLATSSRTAAYEPVDATDAVSAHINVALVNAIAYGMSDGLTGPNSGRGIGATLDTIFRFDEDTCPMCMTHGGNDEYSPLSSSMVWRRLRGMGVSTELHTYPDKNHGAYGLDRHVEFLRKLGWLPSSAPVAPLERWADDSARGSVKTGTAADGAVALTWHRPATHTTGSVQILLEGPSAASEEVRDALVATRRYLNATGITVVTAQIRADSAVADAREAVRAVRAGAADRGLDAGYVGLMGFRADAATAVLAATTSEADCKAKWAVAISPTGLDGEALAVTANTPPTLFVHEETNTTEPAVGSVASWEAQRVLYVQGAVHTLAGEGPDFISAAAVPGTGAYTYLNRVYEFLSDKKDLVAWTGEAEEEGGEGGNQDGEDDEGEEEGGEQGDDEGGETEPQVVWASWFDVDFTNESFVAGTDWIARSTDPSGGTFTAADGVESELVKSGGAAFVRYAEGKEGEIAYVPSEPSGTGKTIRVGGRVAVESFLELPAADANAKAGLCFVSGMPYGLAAGTWAAIGSTPFPEGGWVDYGVEFDFAGESAPRLRYSVGTVQGDWIALETENPQIVRVRFESGTFGDFQAEYEKLPPAPFRKGSMILLW